MKYPVKMSILKSLLMYMLPAFGFNIRDICKKTFVKRTL